MFPAKIIILISWKQGFINKYEALIICFTSLKLYIEIYFRSCNIKYLNEIETT